MAKSIWSDFELILELDENGKPFINETLIDEILEVADSEVVIISTVGQTKGKTFLMEILKHGVHYTQTAEQNSENDSWLDEHTSLTKNDWNPLGSEKNKPGIRLYAAQFPSDTLSQDEKKSTMIFLDSQGTTENKNSNFLFSLISAVSSTLIYNVSQTISLHDLKQLEKFTAVAANLRITFDNGEKPFQKLMIFIRDWYRLPEAPHGSTGGQTVLDKELDNREENSERNHVKASFSDRACFLMPHPGLKVTNDGFTGDLSDTSADFKKMLKQLIPFLLKPENLVYKTTKGERISVRTWLVEFRRYVEQLTTDSVVFESIPRNPQEHEIDVLLSALTAANDMFRQELEIATNLDTSFDDHQLNQLFFKRCEKQAIDEFRKKCGINNIFTDTIQLQKFTNQLSRDYQGFYDCVEKLRLRACEIIQTTEPASSGENIFNVRINRRNYTLFRRKA